MLMSTLDGVDTYPAYPELAGKRVLITGLTRTHGVDIARAFAEHRTRLILHASEDCFETQAVAEIAAQSTLEMRLFTGPLSDADAVIRFARTAVKSFAGLDIVINIADEPRVGTAAATELQVEQAVAAALRPAYVISRIAANRMRTTWTDGLILNIVPEPAADTRNSRALTAVARATIAAMTRSEAEHWAETGIRINAIAPATLSSGLGPQLTCEPDIAGLALRLASRRSRDLSGIVFEAATR